MTDTCALRECAIAQPGTPPLAARPNSLPWGNVCVLNDEGEPPSSLVHVRVDLLSFDDAAEDRTIALL